jgi:hypothetical protein
MQPLSNTGLAPANAAPSASNAAERSGRSSATDQQQQFSPVLRAAIETSASKNSQTHSQRTDNDSSPKATNKPGREVSSDKKPIFSTAAVDLPTLLRAHALSLQMLEANSAAAATNFAGDPNSSGATVAQDKTCNSQLQNANLPPIAIDSGTPTTTVIPSLQSMETQSFPGLSLGMFGETSTQTSEIRSAAAASSGIFSASAKISPQIDGLQSASKIDLGIGITTAKLASRQNELRPPSTESNLNSI